MRPTYIFHLANNTRHLELQSSQVLFHSFHHWRWAAHEDAAFVGPGKALRDCLFRDEPSALRPAGWGHVEEVVHREARRVRGSERLDLVT